ncbi:MAG: hypothetical protein H0T71_05360, partial [Acidobacteria bacterium]|nr:hypothetical protein [Acidobacteriota bacterium]
MPSPASLDVTSARPAADSQASDDLRTEVARLHTALADTRAQLARARRMESVGTLAASIAAALNNVLTPIVMASALLDQQLTDTESRRLLAVLDESAQRGAALVRQILSFTRDMQQAPLSSDPRQIFEDLRRVIAEGFPHSLQLDVEVASDVRGISIDTAGLLPVLMALCAAARDAMPGGGCLTLRAENMMVDDAQAAGFAGVRPGMFVVMSISASAGAMGAGGVCSLE